MESSETLVIKGEGKGIHAPFYKITDQSCACMRQRIFCASQY